MKTERIQTIVIGGGQAGLTMSHCLTKHGQPHVVLERYRIAERWRTERWDSLRFQFPNWAMALPDFAYAGNDPNSYAPRDDVVRFIEAYAAFIRAPVRTGVEVRALRQAPDGFMLDTGDTIIEARNVVIATGPYQQPSIPAEASRLDGVLQISASGYRNPDQLPPGGVLVVGSGASGCQIAEELMSAGRSVYLSVSPHRRAPRRYRGQDIIWWITQFGLDNRLTDATNVRQPPMLISGANGGHTVDLRAFAASGMVLVGRLQDAVDGVVSFASDLEHNLAAGDATYAAFIRAADAHTGHTLPEEAGDVVQTGSVIDPIQTLDLRAAGIGTIIWATGYRYNFNWVDLDVFGGPADRAPQHQAPKHQRGVTNVPGIYVLGLPFLHKAKSSFLSGVGDDAAYLAEQITLRTNNNETSIPGEFRP